jgi:hypothetical protein
VGAGRPAAGSLPWERSAGRLRSLPWERAGRRLRSLPGERAARRLRSLPWERAARRLGSLPVERAARRLGVCRGSVPPQPPGDKFLTRNNVYGRLSYGYEQS